MKPREERTCDGRSREHRDALLLVELLLDHNGDIEETHEEVADSLGFRRAVTGGMRQIDMSRYHRARNHVRDRIADDGRPCCAFTIHYRRSGRNSVLALIDPSGDLGSHAIAAIATIRGFVSRERQHHTENQRQIESVELLADHVLSNSDRQGYRLLQRVAVAIEEHGTIPPTLMAELEVWLAGLAT